MIMDNILNDNQKGTIFGQIRGYIFNVESSMPDGLEDYKSHYFFGQFWSIDCVHIVDGNKDSCMFSALPE